MIPHGIFTSSSLASSSIIRLFRSPYQGQNSFLPKPARAFSVTTTAFLGRKLWSGASIYFNPEMAGGQGLSSTLGIAGFPNGETFRIGADQTVVYVARIFLRSRLIWTMSILILWMME
ncbi:MAG: hypothetical protein WDM78_07395 [Puia sp.]